MLCCRVLQKDIIQCDEQQVAVLFYFKESGCEFWTDSNVALT